MLVTLTVTRQAPLRLTCSACDPRLGQKAVWKTVELKGPAGAEDRVVAAALSQSDKCLVVVAECILPSIGMARYETRVLVYDLSGGRLLGEQSFADFRTGSLAVVLDGAAVLRGRDGRLLIADPVGQQPAEVLAAIKDGEPAAGPVFSPDGRTFAVASHQRPRGSVIRVFEWASRSLRQRFEADSTKVTALAFSPDGATLASGHEDGTILLWDLTGKSASPAWLRRPTPPATLWQRLRDPGAARSGEAMQELVHRPDIALSLFRKHRDLLSLRAPSAARLKELLALLDAEKQADRKAALRELYRVRRLVEPQLRQALAAKPSVEVQHSLARLLADLPRLTPDEVFHVRCVEVLERIGTPAARKMLRELAAGPSSAILTREVSTALRRLAAR
jgi:hypothetical protein